MCVCRDPHLHPRPVGMYLWVECIASLTVNALSYSSFPLVSSDTHAHLHKYKQANRHQSEVASWDLFILHFHQLAFGLSTLATTRYDCYNTWRGGENSKLVSPWKPTFSSPVSTYKGFQSAPYREGDEEQWKNLIRLLGVFFPLWQLRFSGHF